MVVKAAFKFASFAMINLILLADVYSAPLYTRLEADSGTTESRSVFVRDAEKTYTGDGTYYAPGLGACGKTNNKDDLIVAVGHGLFDSFATGAAKGDPNFNAICGKWLKATYQGQSVTVKIEDRCAGCAGANDIDFTEAGFQKLAPLAVGRLHGLKWEFL